MDGGFQYPLADRVGFWGPCRSVTACSLHVSVSSCGSSWFLGNAPTMAGFSLVKVSVSSCGSSWFLGACRPAAWRHRVACFSILLRIELVFGAASMCATTAGT